MKKLIILPGLILACVFLTGCIGLVVFHPRQKCSEQFCLGNRGVVSNGVSATPLTETNVLALWGQPDAQRIATNGMTVWHYQGKLGWTVVMPAYLIILPIPFPAGHDQVEIYFQDGIARKSSRPVTVYTGAMLGGFNVLAWEKEDNVSAHGTYVGSGFIQEDKPASSTANQPSKFP